MVNLELYNVAASCASDSCYVDVVFENAANQIFLYDVLEFKSCGAFANVKSRDDFLWPRTTKESFSTESLYVVDSIYCDGENVRATLLVWSFGGVAIRGLSEEVQDVVVTNDLLTRLPSGLNIDSVESMVEWLTSEFLFNTVDGESLFFRVIGGANDTEGFWLGRKWLADVIEKRIGDKNYLVIEKLRKSPQKSLNLQCGFANVRFVGENDAVEANPMFRAQFALGSSDPNSIINLWKKYNDADESLMNGYRDKAGILRIDSVFSKSGKICARIQNGAEDIENFKDVYDSLKGEYSVSFSMPFEPRPLSVKNVTFNSNEGIVSWNWEDRPVHEKIKNASLKIDFIPWFAQIKRRKDALESVRSRNIPIQTITDILNKTIAPSFENVARSRLPNDLVLRKAFGSSKPNDAQLQALKVCLGTPDIALIQGPPGTGKTSVIRALQNILQSTDAKNPKAVPSVLLTSFQHVAVDNVASGSRIWGLPVFRFYGAKKDKEHVFEGLKAWQQETAKAVEEQMELLQVEDSYDKYDTLRDKLCCLADAESAYEVRTLLMEILALSEGEDFLSKDEISDLQEWKRKYTDNRKNKTFYSLLMRIRTTPEGFSDDGPANISGLITYFDLLKDTLNCPALEQNRKKLKKFIHETPSEEDYSWLQDFRNECLEQINVNSTEAFDRRLFRTLQAYIDNTLLVNIEERIKHSDIYLMRVLKEYHASVGFKSIRRAMLNYAVTYAATTQQSKSDSFIKLLGDKNFGFDYVIVDEAARANPLDLFIPMTLARKKVILVGDHRQLPQLVDQEILEQMDGDELPANLKEFMEKSLFESLWNYLKCERNDGVCRTVSLNIQYRMPKKLGDFISKNFYGSTAGAEGDGEELFLSTGKDPIDCVHNVSRYKKRNDECMCAAWEDVEGKETGFKSKVNEAEARRIVDRLKEIVAETDETIGVIASYSAQVKRIEELVQMDADLRKAVEKQQLEIGSIDAFQGKQFDIVFFSVVRQNDRNDFGFLKKDNRLNVAFSRQKKLLVVVGNRSMYSSNAAQKDVPSLNAFIELADSEV